MWFKASAAMVNVSEGMTLTLTNFQMKLFNAIAAAAVIGASFIAANPAEARNGWVQTGSANGVDHYSKFDNRKGNYVSIISNDSSHGMYRMTFNCRTWDYTIRSDGSGWRPIMPGSIADIKARTFC